MAAPSGWTPDRRIPTDGLSTINGGKLYLGYTTEVLHAAWAWRRQQSEVLVA
ncbi:hypothetical protein ACXVUM_07650 [Williamsia sp. SKLECPSW1]